MLEVTERGERIAFSFEDVLRYHGGHSPGGAAIAYKVLERALPALGMCERREIAVETAFGGPGARDAFELVTRAVTDGRYRVDAAVARPDRGAVLERFAWRLSHPRAGVELVLLEGFVDEEFVSLAGARRDAAQEARLTALKRALAERVLARPAGEVVSLSPCGGQRGPAGGAVGRHAAQRRVT
jgi:hypothetical protein